MTRDESTYLSVLHYLFREKPGLGEFLDASGSDDERAPTIPYRLVSETHHLCFVTFIAKEILRRNAESLVCLRHLCRAFAKTSLNQKDC